MSLFTNHQLLENSNTDAFNAKSKFIAHNIAAGGNKQILKFIAEVKFHQGLDVSLENSDKVIRCLFGAGYCYYFACMLKRAFPGGEVYLLYPLDHMTYQYHDILYDIDGVTSRKYKKLVSVKDMGSLLHAFMHNGTEHLADHGQIICMILQQHENETCDLDKDRVKQLNTKNDNTKNIIEAAKVQFIDRHTSVGGNKQILKFIADILFHSCKDASIEDSVETIRCLFESGYCYYFACMLDEAFPGGDICLMYPFGHITYVYDGIIYDISGVSDNEYEKLIPIKHLGDTISIFKHNGDAGVSRDKCRRVADECIKQGKIIEGKGYFALKSKSASPSKIEI